MGITVRTTGIIVQILFEINNTIILYRIAYQSIDENSQRAIITDSHKAK